MMQKRSTFSDGHDTAELSSSPTSDGRGDASKADSSEMVDTSEAVELLQRRPSVRDLASKFEKGRGAATRIGTEAKSMDSVHLSGEAEFQQLRRILVDLRRRVAGRDKGDVERALSTADSLEAKFAQVGAQLAQGRWEVKKVVLFFNQQVASDAKRMLEDIRSVASIEIEAAKESITNLQSVLQEHKQTWTGADREELEELKREAQEARRIKMLHESSMAREMENQINSLRQQLVEKAAEAVKLRKEVETIRERGQEGGKSFGYLLAGDENLGSTLSIVPVNDIATDLSDCTVQWYQINDDRAKHLISGAVRPQYAPEPSNVGRILRAEVNLPDGKTQAVQTAGPITSGRGLDKYVEMLASKGGAQFDVRIVLRNGETEEKQQLHTFDVNKTRIKLHRTNNVKAKEVYTSSMQLCGARGGGDSAAQGLFWVAKKDKTFMLVLESERERNAAIMLARKFANVQNVQLTGPGDITELEA